MKPLTETAVVTAEGPGSGTTSIFCLKHSLIKIAPGSYILGVPASEINEIILFSFNKLTIFDKFFTSLNL